MHIPHSFATIVFGVSLAGAVTGALQTQRVSAEQQVLATDDDRNEALRRGDPAPLERIYADDYTLVTSLGQVRSKAEQINELRAGQLRYPTIEILDRQIRMYGDVAVVLSRQKNSIVEGSKRIVGEERITRIYKQIDGGWRVIATHATSIQQQ